MKWLPIILALIFFKLTVFPTCATDVSCCTEIENSMADGDSDKEQKDCCSDCSCIHTSYTSVLSEVVLVLDQDEVNDTTFSFDYSETYHHLYVSQLWHPPLYS